MNAPGEADAAGLPDSAGLPGPAELAEQAELTDLPDSTDLPERADLAGLPGPAELAAPAGQLDPAGLPGLADEAELARAVLETIREASAAPRLIALEEILERLRERGLAEGLETSPQAETRLRLAAIVAALPEIASLAGRSGRTLYHDPALLSRAYARLLDNKDDVAVLLAEEIRCNSRDYPRPVSVDLFEKPPFDLTPETLGAALDAMAVDPAFTDIATIRTSLGTVYLYSSRHLEPGYATFLAEQDDALVLNP